MKSFSILRTNVGLTTNVKVIVDSRYNLYLESIDSIPDLSISKYKKVSFNKDNYYDELVPYFWKGVKPEISYSIKYDNDNNSMSSNFANQYDEIYQYGAKNIINNKSYSEEFEYFAPLYIAKGKLPSNFIIFRVDGIGLLRLDKFNFKSEILNKMKVVRLFDMTKKTVLGEWLDNNFVRNSFLPDTPFEMNFRRLEFSKWNGIDYSSGGYISKSLFLDDYLEKENEIFEFEKFIFDNYKNNGVIFPHILNFSFLFDDTPANGDLLRKWSINRYYGFYLNSLDIVKTVSPYTPPELKQGVVIRTGNILDSTDGTSPFVEEWSEAKDFLVEYNGEYYKVVKFTEELESYPTKKKINNTIYYEELEPKIVDRWRIISDIDLTGKEGSLNSSIIRIDSNKRIVDLNGDKITMNDFELGDVYIIKIEDLYHSLVKDSDGYLKLVTDYEFEFKDSTLKYYINKNNENFTKYVEFKNPKTGEQPKKFPIYRLNFTDIKDFDDKIVDTEFSKFEYEKLDELTDTDETKMYMVNLKSKSFPKEYDKFILNNQEAYVPVSSEYVASQEIFKIQNDDLTPLWRKNPVYCRWAYNHSLSSNDYPYLLNNSFIFERFNRTTNPYEPYVDRIERSLDYFYTINSSTYSYLHHTLHVEKVDDYGIDRNFKFDFGRYVGSSKYISGTNSYTNYNFDYFTHFFSRKSSFLNNQIKKNTDKYSYFAKGDNNSPNVTLFRGIKFSIYDVVNIRKNLDDQLEVVNTKTSNKFEDYKFSILLTTEDNGMEWNIIDNWEMDKNYASGSIVIHDDVLYIATTDNITTEPDIKFVYNATQSTTNIPISIRTSPYSLIYTQNSNLTTDNKSLQSWIPYYDEASPFWNPYRSSLPLTDTKSYNKNSIIFKDDEWYYYTGGSIDFWNPFNALLFQSSVVESPPGGSDYYIIGGIQGTFAKGYNKDSFILHRGSIYKSLSNYNFYNPDAANEFTTIDEFKVTEVVDDDFVETTKIDEIVLKFWKKVSSNQTTKWEKVPIWTPGKTYNYNSFVLYDDVVYSATFSNPVNSSISYGEVPGVSNYWKRVYSLEADTNFIYGTNSNRYLMMNDSIYQLVKNDNKKTLESGVRIYINKKWKNILLNIYINDNTLSNLRNSDRDEIYQSIYRKLTANNLCSVINDVTRKFDFTDYLKYTIIEENGSVKNYDINNIESLPVIIFADKPEKLDVKINSLIKTPISYDKLKPTNILKNNTINNLNDLNYYNNINIAASIEENINPIPIVSSYHGTINVVNDTIFRYSGDYMPLFYDIDLFKRDNTISYNEIQLIFYTNISDDFEITFTLNGVSSKQIFSITMNDYYSQLMNIIYNWTDFSDAGFIFEVLPKGSQYIFNNINKNYDVLSIKYKSSFGNIGVSITQIKPILLFDIEDSTSASNISFILSATSGHPPYEYAFGYVSGTYSYNLSSFSSTDTYYASKSGAIALGDSKMTIEIYAKDSYGATSGEGRYTLNASTETTTVDPLFYYEFIN